MDTTTTLYTHEDIEIRSLGIAVPRWIDEDITCGTVAAIIEGGCDSGAYMPAVTYHTARETMAKHGDDVLTFLEDSGTVPPDITGHSWSGYACAVLSTAVEVWAYGVEDEAAEALENDEDAA